MAEQPSRNASATLAVTANVKDALRLGCSAIGYTIYPGSDAAYDQMRDIAEMACEAKDLDGVFAEVRAVRDGGANGSIIGRITFQRPRDQALDMLDKIIGIYQGKM